MPNSIRTKVGELGMSEADTSPWCKVCPLPLADNTRRAFLSHIFFPFGVVPSRASASRHTDTQAHIRPHTHRFQHIYVVLILCLALRRPSPSSPSCVSCSCTSGFSSLVLPLSPPPTASCLSGLRQRTVRELVNAGSTVCVACIVLRAFPALL